MPESRTYYIETYGCQMNEYDSQLVESILRDAGMVPAGDRDSADCLLLNTCSVREHAEQRVFSLLSQYRVYKEGKRGMKMGILGCMASRYGDELLQRFPYLDLAVGPEGYRDLPRLLKSGNGAEGFWRGEDLREDYDNIYPAGNGLCGYTAVIRGCDNYCSYCVVPYVRGRERSRPAESIISEIEYLARQGMKEITLLGQNVNSYRFGDCDFAGLLRMVNQVEGIARVRFLTSHPKDLSEEILGAMAECEKIAPHLHLPFQAGSDRILQLMNRKYTITDYLELVGKARDYVPGISITTDIMTGFPTETEEDFACTMDVVREVRFDDAFTYRYSHRPGTVAAGMADDVPLEVKIDRLQRLIALTRVIARENLEKFKGEISAVLIERESKKDNDWWMGRTEHNRIAVLPKGDFAPGDVVKVRIEGVSGFTLKGFRVKGERLKVKG